MGLAKLKASNATLTEIEITSGTPYYASPETLERKVGKPSDIWSFGVTMVELFGGAKTCKRQNHFPSWLRGLPPRERFI